MAPPPSSSAHIAMRSFLGADTDPRSKKKQKALKLSKHMCTKSIQAASVGGARQMENERGVRKYWLKLLTTIETENADTFAQMTQCLWTTVAAMDMKHKCPNLSLAKQKRTTDGRRLFFSALCSMHVSGISRKKCEIPDERKHAASDIRKWA